MNQPLLPPGASNPQAPAQTPQDGPLVELARTVEQLPGYLFDFAVGLLIASMVDHLSTALTIAAVALGFITGSWLIGVAVFFTGYVVIRTINNVAGSIASGANNLAISTAQVAQTTGHVASALAQNPTVHTLPQA